MGSSVIPLILNTNEIIRFKVMAENVVLSVLIIYHYSNMIHTESRGGGGGGGGGRYLPCTGMY